jgi:hypothetical protein
MREKIKITKIPANELVKIPADEFVGYEFTSDALKVAIANMTFDLTKQERELMSDIVEQILAVFDQYQIDLTNNNFKNLCSQNYLDPKNLRNALADCLNVENFCQVLKSLKRDGRFAQICQKGLEQFKNL